MNADFRRILRKHGGRPWATRRNLAVWRGATTGGEFRRGTWRGFLRSRLVLLSRRRPDLLDAGFHWIDAQADAETVAEMRAADMERRKLTYDEQAAFKVTPPTHTRNNRTRQGRTEAHLQHQTDRNAHACRSPMTRATLCRSVSRCPRAAWRTAVSTSW